MSGLRLYRLHINPQTKINVSDNERWMFAESITDKYLLNFGAKKRQRQIDEGKDPKKAIKADAYYKRKQYVLKYFDYKRKVKELFLNSGLKTFPTDNIWIRFYIPTPPSWSKKKRNKHNFEKHESKPDVTNIFKSLEDSCSEDDKLNWDYRASKFWYDGKEGYIEIEVGGLQPAIGYKKFETEEKLK